MAHCAISKSAAGSRCTLKRLAGLHGTCSNSASLAPRKSVHSGRESFGAHGDHTRTVAEEFGSTGMAFSEEEEVSPQENYGGGRQTISIFGCGAHVLVERSLHGERNVLRGDPTSRLASRSGYPDDSIPHPTVKKSPFKGVDLSSLPAAGIKPKVHIPAPPSSPPPDLARHIGTMSGDNFASLWLHEIENASSISRLAHVTMWYVRSSTTAASSSPRDRASLPHSAAHISLLARTPDLTRTESSVQPGQSQMYLCWQGLGDEVEALPRGQQHLRRRDRGG